MLLHRAVERWMPFIGFNNILSTIQTHLYLNSVCYNQNVLQKPRAWPLNRQKWTKPWAGPGSYWGGGGFLIGKSRKRGGNMAGRKERNRTNIWLYEQIGIWNMVSIDLSLVIMTFGTSNPFSLWVQSVIINLFNPKLEVFSFTAFCTTTPQATVF